MLDRTLDYLVIGAGPAGLQLGALLDDAGRDYLILEAGASPGTFFTSFPRHRTLISINKPHTGTADPELNLRMDWNSLLSADPDLLFTRYSERYFPAADDLVRYLADFAERLELRVRYGTRAQRIARVPDGASAGGNGDGGGNGGGRGDGDGDSGGDGVFVVTDQHGSELRARRLVMATGLSKPYIPPIPGIELAEQYTDAPVDPAGFTDQRVLILGKGNSAFETADNLVEKAAVIHLAGPGSLRLAWQTHFVGHVRAVNNNFLDTYQLKSQNAVLDGTVLSIEREGDSLLVRFSFSRADEFVKELRYDRIVCATGFRFDASVFDPEIRPRLAIKDRFPEQTSAYESIDVPGLYFAGTLMQQRDFKKSTTGFIHGFRYTVRALHHILEERHQDRAWPARELETTSGDLADAVLARVNRSSGLWQQFGVLADLITVPADGPARYVEEVPTAYALDTRLASADTDGGTDADAGGELFTVTLEYGPDHDKVDPFDITVRRTAQDAAAEAHDAAYLHPVVRHYRGGVQARVHHVAENLENDWSKPEAHRAPLEGFFARALDRTAVDSATVATPGDAATPVNTVNTVSPVNAGRA